MCRDASVWNIGAQANPSIHECFDSGGAVLKLGAFQLNIHISI